MVKKILSMLQKIDLMLVGHMSKDEIVIRGQEHETPGGAAYYGAFAARANGSSCLVVTKVAPEDSGILGEFAEKGIEVCWTPDKRTCGIRNIYNTEDQDRRTCILLHAGEPFQLEDIPDVNAKILHIGPLLAGQFPEELIEPLAVRFPLGLDLQGFVRKDAGKELVFQPWFEADRFLQYVTYLKADAAEAEAMTGEKDLDRAAFALARLGPKEVVLSHATGVRVVVDGKKCEAPIDPTNIVARTGRGDSCMSAYLSARIQGESPEWATRYAAALTSMKIERNGPFDGTYEEVLERMGE
ncbi:MAG: PfkB family carbohydrate kinase [Pseudomonadota bacterium]